MTRDEGKIIKQLDLDGHRPYFLLDMQANIIQVDTLSKKITLLNSNLDVLIENVYLDVLDNVYITNENKLAFIDSDKKYVLFV